MKCEKCVTYEVQSTSAVALRDSVLLEFSHDDFRELATRYPRLNIWLARLMSMRLHGVIRQADEIISVGAADASPNLTEVELEILRKEKSRHVKPRKGLILLQPPGTARPEGTIRWLSSRHVDRHFHIRTGNQNDLDRVIRYVLRRETGLVLSGGGSRGFAHVAVDVVLPVDETVKIGYSYGVTEIDAWKKHG